jgi:hypothetical protein
VGNAQRHPDENTAPEPIGSARVETDWFVTSSAAATVWKKLRKTSAAPRCSPFGGHAFHWQACSPTSLSNDGAITGGQHRGLDAVMIETNHYCAAARR